MTKDDILCIPGLIGLALLVGSNGNHTIGGLGCIIVSMTGLLGVKMEDEPMMKVLCAIIALGFGIATISAWTGWF